DVSLMAPVAQSRERHLLVTRELLALVGADVGEDPVEPRAKPVLAGQSDPPDALEGTLKGFLDGVIDVSPRTEHPSGLSPQRLVVVVDDDRERVGVPTQVGSN